MIRAAITYQGKHGLFAYIAPYRSQAKAVAWQYFKEFAQPIISAVNEQELTVTLMNGSQIRLYGAANADAMRGRGVSGGDWLTLCVAWDSAACTWMSMATSSQAFLGT